MKSILSTSIFVILTAFLIGQTNPTPQALPYSQNFNTLLPGSTTYPVGVQGWNQGAASTSFVTSEPSADRNMLANSNASINTINLHNYRGKIGFLNSDIANLALATSIQTSSKRNIQVSYRMMVIRNPYDGSSNTRISESTIQYRVGETGSFTTISGYVYQSGTTTQTNATINEQNPQNFIITLPSVCEDKAVVQIRWLARDVSGSGSRPSFAIDDISITGDPITLPVEFSGMSVTPGPNNNVHITWTTQSETGVNGFYVLRGSSDLLSEAVIISPLISAANSSTTQNYFFMDTDLPAPGLYHYWLQSLDYNGETAFFGPSILIWSPGDSSGASAPRETGFQTLYPNPFNPSLTINYVIKDPAPTQFTIYNLRGQKIKTWDLGTREPGAYNLIWTGIDDGGEACPSGVYRIMMQAGKVIDYRKVLLLK